MADQEKDERTKALTQALWYSVGQIVDDKVMKDNRNATPQYIAALTQVVWTQMESIAQDLEAFANHAGRTTISTDDVLLLCRRNQDLHHLIKDFIDKDKAAKVAGKKKAGRN